MSITQDLSQQTEPRAAAQRCLAVRDILSRNGLYGSSGEMPDGTRFRISPAPFTLSPQDVKFFEQLGDHLLAFYRGLNQLYVDSARGAQPAWIAAYLDLGKPESLVSFSRLKRWRDQVPGVIRPDVIPTADGMAITELDSVPGGIGLTGALGRAYGQWAMGDGQVDQEDVASRTFHAARFTPHDIIGGPDGMIEGFGAMLREAAGAHPETIAIVVSDEARDYRPEMTWMAERLQERGLDAVCIEPRDLRFTEEGLWLDRPQGTRRISLVYRFFELFDLPNVPKADLLMYSAQGARVAVTPPFKPALEEKMAFALVHHPALRPYWGKALGEEGFGLLSRLFPRTWILDPRPIPPSGIIPGLTLDGRALLDFRELAGAGQKARRLVVKPSGFSELAWGSRGVSVGHDLPQSEWAAAMDRALDSFGTTPYVLQEFHKGKQFDLSYYDERSEAVVPMAGRVRLSPYYFVTGGRAKLGGILATICGLDKKVIHGMKDAIMAPCAIAPQEGGARVLSDQA